MEKSEKALTYFDNSFNCSQSVFTIFATDMGLTEDDALKIACAFGGGMGRQQHTCGAVTGALMALGLKFGKGFHDEDENKYDTYAKTLSFFEEFTKRNGSIECRQLLDGLDMNDENDKNIIQEQNLFNMKCRKYVKDAIEITQTIIDKQS